MKSYVNVRHKNLRFGNEKKGTPFPGVPFKNVRLLPGFTAGQILSDHQSHLEDDGMVKLPQIKAGELLDLFQTVDQGVAVDEQLPGGFGNVQIVLEELVDGEQGLRMEMPLSALLP